METTIPAVQHAIQNNIITAQQLVEMYLARIAAYDGQDTATHLNSYLLVNPRAVKDAREANQGRANGFCARRSRSGRLRMSWTSTSRSARRRRSTTQDLAVFSQMFDLSPDSADTDRDVRDRAEDIQRSRGAILALLNGPDGNPGTADDYDAFLASGNNLAGTPAKAGFPSTSFRRRVPERRDAGVPGRIQCERWSCRRDLLRPCVQRAALSASRTRARRQLRHWIAALPEHDGAAVGHCGSVGQSNKPATSNIKAPG